MGARYGRDTDMTEFSIYSILNGYDHDQVVEHYVATKGCDPDDVSRIHSLVDLQLAMGDLPEVTTTLAEAMRDELIDRDLLDWINDRDGGVFWGSDAEFLEALNAVLVPST